MAVAPLKTEAAGPILTLYPFQRDAGSDRGRTLRCVTEVGMTESYADRVHAIPWADYKGSCGSSPLEVPDPLIRLAGADHARSLIASAELWNLLCHQANVASVAVPALPFLLEVLDRAPDELAVEIMDMLYIFAAYTAAWRKEPLPGGEPAWVSELRTRVAAERPRFRQLAKHPNVDIAEFAQMILDEDN